MELIEQAELLKDTLLGKKTGKMPNFEFFWGNPEVEKYFIGKPVNNIYDKIKFAKAIGWGAVIVGGTGWVPGAKREKSSDGISHYAGGLLNMGDDLNKLKLPDIDEKLNNLSENIRMVKENGLMAFVFITHCFHSIATSMGLEKFALACYDDFDFLKRAMELIEGYNQKVIFRMFERKIYPDFILFDGDCAYKNGMMISPELYRKLTFDCTKKTLELLKEASIPYLFHTDGKVDDIYPFLIEWGFSGVHSIEAQANNLGDVKNKFGKVITLIGNFDPVFIVTRSPEEIILETKKMLDTGSKGGRFVAALNTIVSDHIPSKNYLAFWQTIRQYNEN